MLAGIKRRHVNYREAHHMHYFKRFHGFNILKSENKINPHTFLLHKVY